MLRSENTGPKPLRLVSSDRSGLVWPGLPGAAVTSRFRSDNLGLSIGTKHLQLVRNLAYRANPDSTTIANTSGPNSSKRCWSDVTTATHPFLDTLDFSAATEPQHLFPILNCRVRRLGWNIKNSLPFRYIKSIWREGATTRHPYSPLSNQSGFEYHQQPILIPVHRSEMGVINNKQAIILCYALSPHSKLTPPIRPDSGPSSRMSQKERRKGLQVLIHCVD